MSQKYGCQASSPFNKNLRSIHGKRPFARHGPQ
jgi:hypothetical protein